jgi:hypothetical protein
VEISFNIETEHFVEFSLNWFLFIFINIDDIPLLVDLSMFAPNNDVSLFIINSSVDIHKLSPFIDNEWRLVSEELPPS